MGEETRVIVINQCLECDMFLSMSGLGEPPYGVCIDSDFISKCTKNIVDVKFVEVPDEFKINDPYEIHEKCKLQKLCEVKK